MKRLFLLMGMTVLFLLTACSIEKNHPQISPDLTEIPTTVQETNIPIEDEIEDEIPLTEQGSQTPENSSSDGQSTVGASNSEKHEQAPVYAGEEYSIPAQQSPVVSQTPINNTLSTPRPSTNMLSTPRPSTSTAVTPKSTVSETASQQTVPEQEKEQENSNITNQLDTGRDNSATDHELPANSGDENMSTMRQSSDLPLAPPIDVSSTPEPSTSAAVTSEPTVSETSSQQTMSEQEKEQENSNIIDQSDTSRDNSATNHELPANSGDENTSTMQQSSDLPQVPLIDVSSTPEPSTSAAVTSEPTVSETASQQTPTPETTPIMPAQTIPEPGYTGSLAGEEDTDF